MAAVKISSKVDAIVWEELKQLAGESHRNISGLLTDAIRESVRRRRVRPEVSQHLEDSIAENAKLGRQGTRGRSESAFHPAVRRWHRSSSAATSSSARSQCRIRTCQDRDAETREIERLRGTKNRHGARREFR